MLGPPERPGAHPWPRAWRRRLAGRRQIVATAIGALRPTLRRDRERPHAPAGPQARVAARIARHNSCLRCNARLGRPDLAFADLIDW